MEYARDNGGKIILLRDQGFEERFKPNGAEFELCAAGCLLLLAPWPANVGRKSSAGYAEFHQMNDLALQIASLTPGSRLSVIASFA